MKLQALKNNDSVTVLYNGKHFQYTGEKAEEIYAQCVETRRNPTEENKELLEELLVPIKKILHYGLIEEDSNGEFFLKDTKYPMPEKLAQTILTFADKDYPIEPLVRFWKLCLLNPNKEARDGFFEYCQKYGIVITDNGYAVMYKAVQGGEQSDNKDLAIFVAKQFTKVKKWKKAPSNYFVLESETLEEPKFKISKNEFADDNYDVVGNLETLYENIGTIVEEDGAFNPIFSGGTYGTSIKLGEPVTMPREDCDHNMSNECSYGLHVGHTTYVQSFGYGNDILLACLINPMNVVAIPQYDSSKIRVCEYYPYSVLERNEDGTLSEITDENYWEEDYKDYEDDIFDKLRNNNFSDDPDMENHDLDVVSIAKMIEED